MLIIKPTTVVSSANLMIDLEAYMAMQSCVNTEYRIGLRTHPCGAPWLRIRKSRPVRKSRTQLHRVGSRPRVSSLMTSLEGTMVFNAEL